MARDLLAVYAAVGDNKVKREETVRHLKRHLDPAFGEFNLDEMGDPAKVDADGLLASLEQLPFGEGRRFVIVHDADRLPKEASEAVVSYLKDPNPRVVLLLTAERLPKNTRLYKAVAAAGPKTKRGPATVIDCSLPKAYQLPGLLQDFARAQGVSLDAAGAQEAVSRVAPAKGDPTPMLRSVASQLARRFGNGSRVGVAEVRETVARIVEPKPWDFCDAVCERDLPRALELYGLFSDGSEVMLHMFLTQRLRELLCARHLVDAGVPGTGPLAAELGQKGQDWRLKNHGRWCRRFSQGELVRALEGAAACERTLKGSGSSVTAFVEWVSSVCLS